MAKDEPYDPYALGAANSDPALVGMQPLPPAPQRLHPKRLLAYFVALVLVVAVFREAGGPPKAGGSCTKPAAALDKDEVRQYGVLKWSASGPAGSSVVIGADTTTVPTTLEQGKLSGPTAVKDCAASGLFGVRLPEGKHVLRVFLVGRNGTASVAATKDVTVTAP